MEVLEGSSQAVVGMENVAPTEATNEEHVQTESPNEAREVSQDQSVVTGEAVDIRKPDASRRVVSADSMNLSTANDANESLPTESQGEQGEANTHQQEISIPLASTQNEQVPKPDEAMVSVDHTTTTLDEGNDAAINKATEAKTAQEATEALSHDQNGKGEGVGEQGEADTHQQEISTPLASTRNEQASKPEETMVSGDQTATTTRDEGNDVTIIKSTEAKTTQEATEALSYDQNGKEEGVGNRGLIQESESAAKMASVTIPHEQTEAKTTQEVTEALSYNQNGNGEGVGDRGRVEPTESPAKMASVTMPHEQSEVCNESNVVAITDSTNDKVEHPIPTVTSEDQVEEVDGDSDVMVVESANEAATQESFSESTRQLDAEEGDETNNVVMVDSNGEKVPSSHVQTNGADAKKPSPVTPPTPTEVIELLDSDDDEETEQNAPPAAKRQRTEGAVPTSAGQTSYQSHVARLPESAAPYSAIVNTPMAHQHGYQPTQFIDSYREPTYLDSVPGFTPTWKELMPRTQTAAPKKWRSFQLSLLNVSEFTITGLRVGDEFNGYTTSVAGLRSHIKHISKGHGNAFYERDPEGGGKWHIPLGAYHAFYGFLKSDPMCMVDGISEEQLKIASLGKARLEKDYPSARKLVKEGVPKQLAQALAPFQRGGVDFAIDKNGRALIADEMGLGKTIQGIASMSVYHEEWPLLVLCPSSARYHWQNEFRHWLGKNSAINNSEHAEAFDNKEIEGEESVDEEGEEGEARQAMTLLDDSQVHVLTAGRDAIFPSESTRVVVCSYGLAPALVSSGKITPGMFKCAIVDESHMLKNKATKRTSTLLPVLRATSRCILLSGTPAFARPMELWPQLLILGTERDGWWQEEKEFVRKYVRVGNSQRRAELHTMLMGTVMIRRMKSDILKTLPAKVREQGVIDVMDESTRAEMQECMVSLKSGKGKLCELARVHTSEEEQPRATATEPPGEPASRQDQASNGQVVNAQAQSEMAAAQLAAASEQLRQEIDQRRLQGHAHIRHTLATMPHQMDPMMNHSFVQQMEGRLEQELQSHYQQRLQQITAHIASGAAVPLPSNVPHALNATAQPEPPSAKKAILNHMYTLTGKSKIPFVVRMLKQWMKDPTRGKLCLFAHHIAVLDAIAEGAGLSNAADSLTKYIRIDGSTSPMARQEQINAFQGDPSIRIALLGITAAGVAVTLTASSTVWFAELFWTPAIMIQAEDRCHRIGQQAEVSCLYFVAKGTLDELLWKLIEKKFEDLGEFVEGKEKLKMIVKKTYHSTHELLKTVESPDLASSEEAGTSSDADSACSDPHVEEIGSDLEHEIAELGLSEQMMLNAAADNDDSDPESQQVESDAKPAAKNGPIDLTGTSKSEAICLSDDDDDNEVQDVTESAQPDRTAPSECAPAVARRASPMLERSFPRLRLYKLSFAGPRYGLHFHLFDQRMIVVKRDEQREYELGLQAKPHVGDVLVACNGQIIPLIGNMEPLVNFLKRAKQQGVVELTFAEDTEIADYVNQCQEQDRAARQAQLMSTSHSLQQQSPINVELNDSNPSTLQNHQAQASIAGEGDAKPSAVIEVIDIDD